MVVVVVVLAVGIAIVGKLRISVMDRVTSIVRDT